MKQIHFYNGTKEKRKLTRNKESFARGSSEKGVDIDLFENIPGIYRNLTELEIVYNYKYPDV